MAAAWSQILLPCLLLLLLLLRGPLAAAWHWAPCQPGPPPARHPVLGFWERLHTGMGCASQGRAASGQEVHVLLLRGPAQRMGARQVNLQLGPAPPGRAPILVLSSPAPVVWSLQTTKEQWTFQVSPGSKVSAPGSVIVAETQMPHTPRGLLRWAHEEHGGVSSLVAYRGVNMVYVRHGDDGASPGTCKLRRNFLSPTHFASDLRPRPLQGCLTSEPPGDPEVHVIFSKGAGPQYEPYFRVSARPPAHLTMELQVPGGCCSRRRELVVVLKSEGATSWLVRAHHMAGSLRVLASHKVSVSNTDVGLGLSVSSNVSLGLAYASDPLAWAMEQGLPGVTSYTEAKRVNWFLIAVGLDGEPKAPHPSLRPPGDTELSALGWEGGQVGPGGASTVGLAGALSVACLSERVEARVSKDVLQAAGLSPARVTLRDPTCEAQSNGTHFLLESPLASCGSRHVPALGPISGVEWYQHTVVLWGLRPVAAPRGPSFPVGQAKDSLDSIEFSCPSPAPPHPSRSAKPIPDLPFRLGRVLLSLEAYSSEAFTKAQGPCTVPANSRVFVEAALAAFDPQLSFSICLCFLSPSSSSSLDSPYILVQGGCPARPDVSLHPPHKGTAGWPLPPGSQELQRLSFLLRPLYNDSIQFLHCRLALCTQVPQGQDGPYGGALPKCGPRARACTGSSSSVGEPGSGPFQYTFTKPIIVTVANPARATPPSPGTDPFPVPFPLVGRMGKPLKEAARPEQRETPLARPPQGLELPTIVGIVFSAFVIGVSLTGGLWLIHSTTAHRASPDPICGDLLAPALPSPPAGAQLCSSWDQQPTGLCSAQSEKGLPSSP